MNSAIGDRSRRSVARVCLRQRRLDTLCGVGLFIISDTCRPLVNETEECACAMVVVSTKDARREGGIMPTLSIGTNLITLFPR